MLLLLDTDSLDLNRPRLDAEQRRQRSRTCGLGSRVVGLSQLPRTLLLKGHARALGASYWLNPLTT